jgi:hypothetical protein
MYSMGGADDVANKGVVCCGKLSSTDIRIL